MSRQILPFIYLACPYTHPEASIMSFREAQATVLTSRLCAAGFAVFSPITQGHAMKDSLPENLRNSHDFWLRLDISILARCDLLIVLNLPGIEDSKGVLEEVEFAVADMIPVIKMNPEVTDAALRNLHLIFNNPESEYEH